MRESVCVRCGSLKRPIKFSAFGHDYVMASSLCQSCFDEQVKQDALRLREENEDSKLVVVPVRMSTQKDI